MKQKYTRIGDLFDALERWGFESEGGPLNHAAPWKMLRQVMYDKLMDPVPKEVLEKFRELWEEGED